MKKIRLLTIFSIMFMLLLSLSALTACGHKHDFSGQVLMDKYLAIAASCTNKATYYYSCECGEKGESTFEFGDYVHDYSQKVESSQYVASEGNCFKKGIYFYSCKCGKKGTDVFECENYDHELGADQNCYVCQNPPTIGLDYQLNEDGQSYYVAGTGIAGDVDIVIAPYYNNLPVTKVGAYAFDLGSYESVILHDGITSIDRFAFVGCHSLESIILPNTLKSIGESAFYNCDSLKSIVIPDSVTNIEDNAFIFCRSLTSINIGDGVTNIGKYAFGDTGYYNNQSNWENGVLYLGKYLLETNEISGTYNVKTGTLLIADSAFSNCSDLTSITLPDSVTSIGSYAFYSCHSLESMKIPNSVTSIGDGAFCGCTGLKRITLSDNVTSIGGNAFYNCYSLEGITLSDNVTSIGGNAFYNCYSLEGITIPDNVTSIGAMAFYGCRSLTRINVSENNAMYKSIDGCLYSKDGKTFVKYPQAKGESSFVIPDSIKSISEYAFEGCNSFTDITVPNTVEEIGFGAFSACNELTSIILPFLGKNKEDVQSSYLGYVFGADGYDDNNNYVPKSLKEVTVTLSTQIGEGAFHWCKGLEAVNIGDNAFNIGANAFYGCRSLMRINVSENNSTYKSINGILYSKDGKTIVKYPQAKDGTAFEIPDSTENICDYAFEGCDSFENIIIPDGVKSIGKYALEGCDSLVDIVIPDSVEYIGIYALKNCDDLTSITVPFIGQSRDIPDNLMYLFSSSNALMSLKEVIITSATQIKADAFDYCDSLESISIPDSVTSIESRAFAGCKSLTSIEIDSNNAVYRCEGGCIIEKATNTLIAACNTNVIPDGVEIIGRDAFDGFEITSITIPDSVKIIEAEAFSSCNLTSITIPDSVNSIGEYAFAYCYSLKNVIIDGDGLSIGARAFDNCTSLTSVIIKDGVTSVGTKAFFYCRSLTSVVVSDGVESIGEDAFYYCSALTSVTIGSGVKSIGDSAFLNCRSLTTVYYKGTAAEWDEISIDSYNNWLTNATVYYYCETEPELSEDGSAYDGNYWHYDTDGITPIIWTKQD